mmetsp:Transcript_104607/g.234866  ORF Transcript_104607/g.234866 Transcript_104607/m.234866 type:complete len:591 (-) Transcript_104607:64-1836(-)
MARLVARGATLLLALLSPAVAGAAPAEGGGWSRSVVHGRGLVVQPIFMLKHQPGAVERLAALVEEVSTPGRPGYGKFLSAARLQEQFPAAEGSREAVMRLLAKHGVPESSISVSASGDMVRADMSLAVARDMFQAEFHEYRHPQTKRRIVRAAAGYRMPLEIDGHVYLVGNLNEFPDVRRPIQVHSEVEDEDSSFGGDCGGCRGKVTPGVLAQRYGLNASESFVAGSADTGMATAEFQGVYYDTSSLSKFQNDCKLKQAVQVDKQIGKNVQWHCLTGGICVEALLDIEYAKASSGGIALTNIFNDGYSLLNWAHQVDNLGDAAPAVHSISYGDDEIQQDGQSNYTGKAYMEAVNVQFAKLAARGISILVASGDQGVCGRTGCGFGTSRFHPDFPASSPYVTAVGGTDFVTRGVIGEEQAWEQGGGGFSDEFETPKWQQEAVQSYLAAAAKAGNLPKDSFFNRTGRAYPDVAALGGMVNPYCIAAKLLPFVEKMMGVAGTSASSPVFAGVVARLNAARLAKGMPRMGLLNPWIYKHPEAFHDVTKGVNDGGSSHGFAAMPGWDPATGMGTPSFGAMLRAALQSQDEGLLVV